MTGTAPRLVEVERPAGAGRFVIVCDHASSVIPERLFGLGLGAGLAAEHIAWDIGALAVARRLSAALDAPLVYPTVSRLVIDCNRALDHPDLIVSDTEFGPVPGNCAVEERERLRRIEEVHHPYHAAVASVLRRRADEAIATAIVAIHSFTPVLSGRHRPWHVGIIHGTDARLAHRLHAELDRLGGIVVGLNVPYSGTDGVYHTLDRHAETAGLPSVMIELRNDLIGDEPGQTLWAERLLTALAFVSDAAAIAAPSERD